ncbi:hypothetical protein RHMOL_Rhmol09G0142600 [Rhododendron molle]|uniref:Uncharacterized protein n=1 Tax=Rhododendron molle TaxID=49168 RepID=A0ACC0MDC5_RHOML|nr:hypothetical protein RHMOL_Rhmol09G0142600 [Rhododendron molle]
MPRGVSGHVSSRVPAVSPCRDTPVRGPGEVSVLHSRPAYTNGRHSLSAAAIEYVILFSLASIFF